LNYYGISANVERAKPHIDEGTKFPATQDQREYQKWLVILIQKVRKVDPFICPKWGREMKVMEYVD
jgi:hypothetical protein